MCFAWKIGYWVYYTLSLSLYSCHITAAHKMHYMALPYLKDSNGSIVPNKQSWNSKVNRLFVNDICYFTRLFGLLPK